MNLTATIFKRLLKRKLATALLVTVSSVAAFATLGDGGGSKKAYTSVLNPSKPTTYSSKTFSLRSGYNYKGNNLFSSTPKVQKTVLLNTVTSYKRGNTTYILPLKKKVILDKVRFTSSAAKF
jgi:hypothetical protein